MIFPKENQLLKAVKFGYELEGGFDEEPDGDNQYLKYDGSVSSEDGYAGEIASPAFSIDAYGWDKFLRFSKDNMPIEANDSAGLHCHISFNNELAYSKVMDVRFWDLFYLKVGEFFNKSNFKSDTMRRFNDRHIGNRSYCSKVFCPNIQANGHYRGFNEIPPRSGERYTMLNYPKLEHGTVECRLYPSVDTHEELVKIIEWHIKFTNSYLSKYGLKERSMVQKVKAELDEIDEHEVVLCV